MPVSLLATVQHRAGRARAQKAEQAAQIEAGHCTRRSRLAARSMIQMLAGRLGRDQSFASAFAAADRVGPPWL
jgi:hypothetical protein